MRSDLCIYSITPQHFRMYWQSAKRYELHAATPRQDTSAEVLSAQPWQTFRLCALARWRSTRCKVLVRSGQLLRSARIFHISGSG